MPSTDLHRLLYVSAATTKLSATELDDLLVLSRARNSVDDLTGALLYADGDFIQLLEGPHDALKETFRRIESSSLHDGVIVLVDEPVAQRQFGSWAMAYSRATWEQLGEVRAASQESGDAAVDVLRGFAQRRSGFR